MILYLPYYFPYFLHIDIDCQKYLFSCQLAFTIFSEKNHRFRKNDILPHSLSGAFVLLLPPLSSRFPLFDHIHNYSHNALTIRFWYHILQKIIKRYTVISILYQSKSVSNFFSFRLCICLLRFFYSIDLAYKQFFFECFFPFCLFLNLAYLASDL